MPKKAAGLTAAKVRTAKPGRYVDGDGLMLFVRSPDARFWLLRYSHGGKRREAGLGRAGEGLNDVTLAEARQKAADMRRMVKAGIDPLVYREAEAARQKAVAQQAAAQGVTFRAVADLYMGAHDAGWRNPKHRDQWRNTLATYAFPHFGDLPAGDVGTGHVMAALEPIWTAKPETATRVRGRIESVLDYATARGWRSGENPARWRGHLANLLPARGKVARVEHHAALPWREVGTFMAALGEREADSVAALALRFAILTAARSGEVMGAHWAEIDLGEAVWTVPAERMKAGREHRVPLTAAALAVLRQAAALRTSKAADAFVFPGQRPGKGLSVMALAMTLRRMDRGDLTVHGFRSTFRDWCAEATNFDRDTAEAALAHTLRNKVEAAYRRGDLFDKRRRLMDAWATFCAAPAVPAAEITPIRRTA
jgi:integrase